MVHAILLLCLTCTPALADFLGSVVSVLDGDTIEVLNGHHADRLRLSGIDCPEKGQVYGKKAKQAASALVFGKEVMIQTHGHDIYTRILGEVILADGMSLNRELVKQGWCWWSRRNAPEDTVLERLEAEARESKKGLWADPAPIPPWDYRKARRGHALNLSEVEPLGIRKTRGSYAAPGHP